MLSLTGVFVQLLVSVVPAASESVTVRTELAFFSFRLGGEALSTFRETASDPVGAIADRRSSFFASVL